MKTDKRIEDYLHLYLGCEVIGKPYAGLPFTEKQHFTVRGVLTGVSKRCVTCHFVDINGVKWDQETRLVFQDVKPILRPLNSMTEEEAVDIYNILYPHVGDYQSPNKKVFIVNQYCFGKGIYEENYQSLRDALPYFPILLSKGFDLFDLVPSGLAIDKTTLK
jgi:hypothetical protein